MVLSAAEVEIAGVYFNASNTIPIRHILINQNHIQPPTPLKTDNTTVDGFICNNIT